MENAHRRRTCAVSAEWPFTERERERETSDGIIYSLSAEWEKLGKGADMAITTGEYIGPGDFVQHDSDVHSV